MRPLRLFFALLAAVPAPGAPTVPVQLVDYAAAPVSGELASGRDNAVYVARVNFLREEPGGGRGRFFVCDLNGGLYLLDHATRQFTTYLDFQRNPAEAPNATGLFPAFTRATGYANGLVTFQFDPDYRTAGSPNAGKFYTVHIEIDTGDGDARRLPNASAHPGFTGAASYSPTPVNEAPGIDTANTRHAVLVEWQDTQIGDATFQGTARELLRIEFNGRIHPLGDLLFNPLATNADHPDWRKLYIAVGDGGAGEQNHATLHPTPQRLDVLQGKILRLSPDDPDGSGPLRYSIPADNPFVGAAPPGSARGEIYAYGFRNPHRLWWDPGTNLLLAADIGFHSWEEINVVVRGGNYGWAEREGRFRLNLATGIADGALPADDAAHGYRYPLLSYPHSSALGYGDAIAGGVVYRGTRIPQLRDQLVFGDITTGHLFFTDPAALAADGSVPPPALNRIALFWDNPRDAAPAQRYDRLYEIVEREYHARGGPDANLPGSATVSDLTGGGRADIRLAVDAAGELYVLSKSDGMIRALLPYESAISAAPTISRQPQAQIAAAGSTVVFSVDASADAIGYQWRRNGEALSGANRPLLVLPNVTLADAGSYSVEVSRGPATRLSLPASLTVLAAMPPSRIANFSIRAPAGLGAQTLIAGFAVDESASANGPTLLLRGIGPTLAGFNITTPLVDPRLDLYRGSIRLDGNDNWDANGQAPLLAEQVKAFSLPAGSRDAAFAATSLSAGAYTMHITSVTPGQTGIALAEIFDATSPTLGARQLVNVSARTQVGEGDDSLIAGFVIRGPTARTVLVRAAGPALTAFGVSGVLPDPRLVLYRGSTPIAESDDWRSTEELVGVFGAAGAFNFVARSRDAALVVTLPPGDYTAHVTGLPAGSSNIALIEVYALP